MSLSYWYPSDLADLRRFFEDIEGPRRSGGGENAPVRSLVPKMDLVENKDSHTLAVELPGFKKEDVNVSLEHQRLTISGDASGSQEYNEGKVKVSERSFGHFSRSIQVPPGMTSADIKAEMKDGLLRVTLPKVTQQPEQSKIAIA